MYDSLMEQAGTRGRRPRRAAKGGTALTARLTQKRENRKIDLVGLDLEAPHQVQAGLANRSRQRPSLVETAQHDPQRTNICKRLGACPGSVWSELGMWV